MVEGLHEILEMIEKRFPKWVGTGLLALIMLAIAATSIHYIYLFAVAPVFRFTGSADLKPLVALLMKPIPGHPLAIFGPSVQFVIQAVLTALILVGLLILVAFVASALWRSAVQLWRHERAQYRSLKERRTKG